MVKLLNVIASNSLDDLVQSAERPSIRVEILAGLCLAAGVATAIYHNKKTKALTYKDEMEKRLDDYSYRDLFHFFINPEFHVDKLHHAKGESRRRLLSNFDALFL